MQAVPVRPAMCRTFVVDAQGGNGMQRMWPASNDALAGQQDAGDIDFCLEMHCPIPRCVATKLDEFSLVDTTFSIK